MTPEIIARVDRWLASRRRVGMTDRMAALAHEWSRRSFRIALARTDAAREAVDSAFAGVLLALVREAHAEPSIYACTMRRAEVVFGKVVDAGVEWIVTWGIVAVGCIARANTEAEALVLALEAAPR